MSTPINLYLATACSNCGLVLDIGIIPDLPTGLTVSVAPNWALFGDVVGFLVALSTLRSGFKMYRAASGLYKQFWALGVQIVY